MKKIATALPITLAMTAMAFARAQHQPVATRNTVGSGYSAPSSWNYIEISIPSGGF